MPAASLVQQLESELRSRIAGEVRFDEFSRGLYSTDASIYQIAPVGVVFPKSAADVTATVEIAAAHRVPILPRGSGTSLSGQTVGAALVIDFSRFMNRILDVDVDRRLVRVEPGVVLDELNWTVKPHGLQFGPDVATSSRANLGGMIGNNSAGSRSVRQGKTIDHVRELRVTLSDGSEIHCRPLPEHAVRANRIADEVLRIVADNRTEIIRRYPRILRRVSGYNLDAFVPEIQDQFPIAPAVMQLDREWPDRREFNLARMVVGAEGTLGVVTEAVLHLVPLPKERGVVCLQFETIDAALEATLRILECQPSAIELLDRHIVELSRTNLKYRRSLDFIEGTPDATLIVEFSGDTPVQVSDGIELLRGKTSGQRGLQKWLQAADAEQREKIWNCRKASAPLLLSIPGARKPIAFVEDPAVDPTKMAQFARRFRAILDHHGLQGAVYGHASVGCLHLRPMLDTKSAGDLRILKAVSDEVAELVREFGGAMSGEHGDGLARSYHNLKLFGPKLFAAFGEVKRAFDPLGLMNPGKVTATPSPIESLRYGTSYRGTPVKSFLDFSRETAMAGMIGNSPPLTKGGRRSGLPRGGRNVQRLRRLPQVADRDDVPLVHGHARRRTFDTRPRERAAAGVVGATSRGIAHVRAHARRDGPVSDVQRVQGRMPLERRCRQTESRIPRALPPAASAVARQRADGQRGVAESDRLRAGSGFQLVGGGGACARSNPKRQRGRTPIGPSRTLRVNGRRLRMADGRGSASESAPVRAARPIVRDVVSTA